MLRFKLVTCTDVVSLFTRDEASHVHVLLCAYTMSLFTTTNNGEFNTFLTYGNNLYSIGNNMHKSQAVLHLCTNTFYCKYYCLKTTINNKSIRNVNYVKHINFIECFTFHLQITKCICSE